MYETFEHDLELAAIGKLFLITVRRDAWHVILTALWRTPAFLLALHKHEQGHLNGGRTLSLSSPFHVQTDKLSWFEKS